MTHTWWYKYFNKSFLLQIFNRWTRCTTLGSRSIGLGLIRAWLISWSKNPIQITYHSWWSLFESHRNNPLWVYSLKKLRLLSIPLVTQNRLYEIEVPKCPLEMTWQPTIELFWSYVLMADLIDNSFNITDPWCTLFIPFFASMETDLP